jgi:hypothetical protein
MSRVVTIQIANDQTAFRPGDVLVGGVLWRCERAPRNVEVRLVWFTEGKGTRDVSTVATHVIDSPREEGRDAFRFTLPEAPHSYSGQLITIQWVVEAVLLPWNDFDRAPFVLSPDGREIRNHAAG